MTYCVGIHVDEGLVFASDSRTNAGIDQVSSYKKLHTFVWEGERALFMLSAGNLATTQAVVKRLQQDCLDPERMSLRRAAHVLEAVDYLGALSAEVQQHHARRDPQNTSFEATFVFGGQIGSEAPELYLVYPQGNYIQESSDYPYLQIGETKYGKPILDRVIRAHTPLAVCARCVLVSFDSTVRSNLSVGPPYDVVIYPKNSLGYGRTLHFTADHPYLKVLTESWQAGITRALEELPDFDW